MEFFKIVSRRSKAEVWDDIVQSKLHSPLFNLHLMIKCGITAEL